MSRITSDVTSRDFAMDSDVPAGRSVEISLGTQEVISIDLDDLDPNAGDVIDVLKEGQCKIWAWTKLASEYWRRGFLDAAERIAHAAIDCACRLTLKWF
jgi:RNA polymerase-associated protein CTR9